jgi:hypothetical protein
MPFPSKHKALREGEREEGRKGGREEGRKEIIQDQNT